MTLLKSVIPIAFKGGLDQKTPEKQGNPGTFNVLLDCVRRKTSLVEKRAGTKSLSSRISPNAGAITDGKRIVAYDSNLLLFNSTNAYTYAPSSETWIDKGDLVSATIASTPLVRGASIQAQPDMANANASTITVYEDSRGGVRYSLFDDSTGAALVFDVSLSATGTRPKVRVVNQHFLITYIETGSTSLISRTIPITNQSAAPTTNTVVNTCATAAYDIVTYTNGVFFAINNTSSGLTLGYIAESGVVGSIAVNGFPPPITINSSTTLGKDSLQVLGDPMINRLCVAYYDSATSTALKVTQLSDDLVTVHTAVVVMTASNVRNIGLVTNADYSVDVFAELTPGGSTDSLSSLVQTHHLAWSGTVLSASGSTTVLRRSVGLISKPFLSGPFSFVVVAYESQLQPTYFLLRSDGFVSAKISPSNGGGLTRDAAFALSSGLAEVVVDSSGAFIFPIEVRNRLDIESGGTILATQQGINKISLTLEGDFPSETLGADLHMAGGLPLIFDGNGPSELGYNVYPETPAPPTIGTGSLIGGSYTVTFLYEWVDGKGQIHKSAPSVPIVVNAVAASKKMTFAVPTLRLTSKSGQINIVGYMAAEGLATVFYRVGIATNDETVDTVNFIISDEADPSQEILYTVAGTTSNIAPPAATCLKAHKNRIWLGGLEDGTLWYSREFTTGEGVAFSDQNVISIEGLGGPVLALAELDGALIIFKEDRIYFLAGEGPLDSGQQNDYGTPQRIASDVGTSIPNSVADLPNGVIFKSSKGFFLLNRSYQTEYIGAPVEDYNYLTITGATLLADVNEVRFTSLEGITLVYNFYFGLWSAFSNYDGISSCAALGTYCTLRTTGIVRTENTGFFDDDGRRFNMAMETSWLALNQLQGFQRIYALYILGDFVSHCYAKVQVAYDDEQGYNETVYFNTKTGLVSSDVYGSDDIYGDSETYGDNGGSTVFQFRLKPQRQKCEAIKLRIEDVDTIGLIAGGSFKLTALTCIVGAKRGGYKLPTAKTIRNY